jgi:hypothetical protein
MPNKKANFLAALGTLQLVLRLIDESELNIMDRNRIHGAIGVSRSVSDLLVGVDALIKNQSSALAPNGTKTSSIAPKLIKNKSGH